MGEGNVAFDLKKFADENSELFNLNLQTHGRLRQIIKCCEEMSELGVELCKLSLEYPEYSESRYNNLCTEVADTIITLVQVMRMFSCFDDVAGEINYKLERLYKGLIDE